MTFTTHVTNTIYVAVNIFVTGTPISPYHFIHSITFGLAYITFTVIYHACGGTNQKLQPYVYAVVDWNDPSSAALYAFLFSVCLVIAMWFLLYGLMHVRLAIYRATIGKTGSDCQTKERGDETTENGIVNPAYSNDKCDMELQDISI